MRERKKNATKDFLFENLATPGAPGAKKTLAFLRGLGEIRNPMVPLPSHLILDLADLDTGSALGVALSLDGWVLAPLSYHGVHPDLFFVASQESAMLILGKGPADWTAFDCALAADYFTTLAQDCIKDALDFATLERKQFLKAILAEFFI